MASKPASIKFSNVHGRNIEIKKNQRTAVWVLKHQGGYCFLNTGLELGTSATFHVSGSGHARLGFTYRNPASLSFDPRHDPDSKWFRLRQKKQNITMTVTRDDTRVYMRERDNNIEAQQWEVDDQEVVCVFVDILFGDLTVDIDSDSSRAHTSFDGRHGDIITLSNHNKRACLKHSNLSALCSTERPIHQGEITIFDIEPLQGANWIYTKFFLANYSPEELELNSLDADMKREMTLRLVPIGLKVRNSGIVHLRVEKDKLYYSILMKETKVPLTELDLSKPLFVYAELFRMKMKIRSTIPKTSLPPYLRVDTVPMDVSVSNSDTSQSAAGVIEPGENREHIGRRDPQESRIRQFNHQGTCQNEASRAQAPNNDPDLTDNKEVDAQMDVGDSDKEQTLPKQTTRM